MPLGANVVAVPPELATSPVSFPVVTDFTPENMARSPGADDPFAATAQLPIASKLPDTSAALAAWPFTIMLGTGQVAPAGEDHENGRLSMIVAAQANFLSFLLGTRSHLRCFGTMPNSRASLAFMTEGRLG
ncbi:MAG: hypothetical protein H0W74_04935 [Sphingosinicella sp.]|nr:hypothetical protein [Sphingosinicella sp.]